MHAIKFKVKCPYEIDDRVHFDKCGNEKIMEITNIITQISAKTGEIVFILELDGWYKLNTNLHDVQL